MQPKPMDQLRYLLKKQDHFMFQPRPADARFRRHPRCDERQKAQLQWRTTAIRSHLRSVPRGFSRGRTHLSPVCIRHYSIKHPRLNRCSWPMVLPLHRRPRKTLRRAAAGRQLTHTSNKVYPSLRSVEPPGRRLSFPF